MKLTLLTFLFIIILGIPVSKAQDIPPPNPELAINIVSGQSILFRFDDMSEYINGIMNAGHSTFIRVLSIEDWQLQFKADQIEFYGTGSPANTIPLNNVGVIVVSTGTNPDDGSSIVNLAQTLPLALESVDVTLLTKGTGSNIGGGLRNAFTLNWEMGTLRGNMNPNTMLDQHLGADIYNLDIILTVSWVP